MRSSGPPAFYVSSEMDPSLSWAHSGRPADAPHHVTPIDCPEQGLDPHRGLHRHILCLHSYRDSPFWSYRGRKLGAGGSRVDPEQSRVMELARAGGLELETNPNAIDPAEEAAIWRNLALIPQQRWNNAVAPGSFVRAGATQCPAPESKLPEQAESSAYETKSLVLERWDVALVLVDTSTQSGPPCQMMGTGPARAAMENSGQDHAASYTDACRMGSDRFQGL